MTLGNLFVFLLLATAEPQAPRHKAEVVRLDEWRRNHADKKVGD